MSGTLPPELANLTSLAMLRLSENRISGTIPDAIRANESTPDGEGGVNPHQVEGASALRVLTLTNNLLSGSVPPSLAECSALFSWLSSRLTREPLASSRSTSSRLPCATAWKSLRAPGRRAPVSRGALQGGRGAFQAAVVRCEGRGLLSLIHI